MKSLVRYLEFVIKLRAIGSVLLSGIGYFSEAIRHISSFEFPCLLDLSPDRTGGLNHHRRERVLEVSLKLCEPFSPLLKEAAISYRFR